MPKFDIRTSPDIQQSPTLGPLVARANEWLAAYLARAPEPVTATWGLVEDRDHRPHLLLDVTLPTLDLRPRQLFAPADLESRRWTEWDYRRLVGALFSERGRQLIASSAGGAD